MTRPMWSGRKVIYCTAVYELTNFVHSQRERLLASCGFSPFWQQRGSQIVWYRAEMQVHSCTLSVSMHIQTVSHTQEYHPSTVWRVTGLKSAPHKQKTTAYDSQLNVHGSSQSSTSSALEQGDTTGQSQNYQHLDKGLCFVCSLNTATGAYPSGVMCCVAHGEGLLSLVAQCDENRTAAWVYKAAAMLVSKTL